MKNAITTPTEPRDDAKPAASGTERTLHVGPCGDDDATPVIREALDKCRRDGCRRLALAPCTYHFHPDLAREEYLFISNNDEGLKRLAFFLDGWDGLEVDGQGSLFVFHGFILPFVLQRSANITLRNLRVDWHRMFHSEAVVVGTGEGFVDLDIPGQFPFRIEHGRLVFTGEGTAIYEINNALEFDVRGRETAFKVWDNYGIGKRHRAEELAPGRVRFHARFSEPTPQVGNVLALIDEGRHCPAITISKCRNILLENVTIHHAGGMGVIAQLSHDVTLRECKVVPTSGRMVSLRADATHFVCCGGQILIEDCEFSHQLDDPGNFHNVFTPIVRRVSDRSVMVRLQHFQQWGLEPYEVGHLVEFVQASSLLQEDGGELTGVTILNREHTLLEFGEPLPAHYGPGWAVGSLHWVADVTVRRTRVHSNRARGYLVTTGGAAVFEENYFHSPGAAILVEGDAESWYEAGAVSDLLVRNNVFDNCNYGVWGRATIEINPRIDPDKRAARRFHRNIRVEDNEFRTFHPNLLRAHCVDGLTFRGNTIRFTKDYPVENNGKGYSSTEHCSNVDILENDVVGARFAGRPGARREFRKRECE